MSKMPECYFFVKYGECTNKDCQYLHIDPESKKKDCPWYDRGFCKHGPTCRHRHVKRVPCQNYVTGFCPEGKACKFAHPKWDQPLDEVITSSNRSITCHRCGEVGHKAPQCPHATEEGGGSRLDGVICYKCGERGHFANKCPTGPAMPGWRPGGGGGGGGGGGDRGG
eukprot:Opistho-1_new@48582